MRKVWMLIACSLLCLAFAGVASSAKTPVVWWMHWQAGAEAWVKEWGVKFEEQNPDIKLELETQTASPRDKLVVTVAAGVGPDIVYEVDSVMGPWIESGITLPLNRYFSTLPNRNDFLPDVIEGLTYGGELHAIPFMVWPWGVMWNRHVLSEAGVRDFPKTWDELVDVARRITRVGSDGTIERWGVRVERGVSYQVGLVEALFRQQGVTMIAEEDTQVKLDHAEGIRALEYLRQLTEIGGRQAPRDVDVAGGTGGIYYSWSGAYWGNVIAARPDAAEPGLLGFSRYPGPVAGADNLHVMSANLFITSSSKVLDTAWRVIEAWVEPRNLRDYLIHRGMLPVRRSIFTDPEFQDNAFKRQMLANMYSPLLLHGVKHTRYDLFRVGVGREFLAAFDGQISAAEALIRAEHIINVELAKE
ncbi:MAG: carbohydrate ABC transporter substrate-binding protein [Firmicutes bacterium]|nr:carbohydrate ABC transporter substrate-binding protein [Bacillota bacterium]